MPIMQKLIGTSPDLEKLTIALAFEDEHEKPNAVIIAAEAAMEVILTLFAFLGGVQRAKTGEDGPVYIFRPTGLRHGLYEQSDPVLVFQFQGGAEISFLLPRSSLPKLREILAELETALSEIDADRPKH